MSNQHVKKENYPSKILTNAIKMVMSVRLATRKIAATGKRLKLENVFHAMKRDTKNLMALNILKLEIASIGNQMVTLLMRNLQS